MKGRIFILWLFCTLAHAEIYTWIDNQGVTHFSDSPGPNAKPVQMPKTQSYSPPATTSTIESAKTGGTSPPPEVYQSISITNPPNALTIRDSFGNFPVTVVIEPALQSQDAVQLLIDGVVVQGPAHTQSFQVENVVRGEHKLVAQVVNDKGTVLKSSEAITLYIMPPRIDMGQPPKPLGSGP